MFTQGANGAIMSAAGYFGRRLVPMVTYDDFFTCNYALRDCYSRS